jgi:hypothetical protein
MSADKTTYLSTLLGEGEFEIFKKIISEIFNEPLGSNFIDIITKKVKQGLTMDDIISFHNKYPNKSIFYLFGFISEKINNIGILFSP